MCPMMPTCCNKPSSAIDCGLLCVSYSEYGKKKQDLRASCYWGKSLKRTENWQLLTIINQRKQQVEAETVILRKDWNERARAAKLTAIGWSVKKETCHRKFGSYPKQSKTDIAIWKCLPWRGQNAFLKFRHLYFYMPHCNRAYNNLRTSGVKWAFQLHQNSCTMSLEKFQKL